MPATFHRQPGAALAGRRLGGTAALTARATVAPLQCGNTCGDNETCTFVDNPVGTDPNNQCLCDAGFADCDGNRSNG